MIIALITQALLLLIISSVAFITGLFIIQNRKKTAELLLLPINEQYKKLPGFLQEVPFFGGVLSLFALGYFKLFGWVYQQNSKTPRFLFVYRDLFGYVLILISISAFIPGILGIIAVFFP